MTKAQILQKFNLYLDDFTELSTVEAGQLFDKIYERINSERPWEGTKAAFAGVTSTSTPSVALPVDFLYLTANNNTTDGDQAFGPVVFVGPTFSPYRVVSYSDRRQYRTHTNVTWIDTPAGQLTFAVQPTSALAVEYDYHRRMPTLADGESPWFPIYHDMIYHGMCIDDFVIQQSDKAKSYKADHEKMFAEYMEKLAYYNSQLILQ